MVLASTHGFVLVMALKTPKPTFGGIAHAGILVSDTQASLVRFLCRPRFCHNDEVYVDWGGMVVMIITMDDSTSRR